MQRLGRFTGNLLAVILIVISTQAMAETKLAGRDFNHAATGFPLTGGHATAACETCHVAGVFKGTAKTCDGCHALGKRVVATPKSTSHIVTDAPCDTCHFNASTFLGARFNHGTALPGQCANCHNGRQSMGKPASHSSGNKATKSCDQCHRSFTWFQASWNHVGVLPGTCSDPGNGCHTVGENQYNVTSVITRIGKSHTNFTYTNNQKCDVCHNFVRWSPATHMPLTGSCSSCHTSGTAAEGPAAGHTSFVGWPIECNSCHKSMITWLGAGFHSGNEAGICRNCHNTTVQPSSHTKAGVVSLSCDKCHTQTAWTGAHTSKLSLYCGDCHSTDSNAVKEHGTISVGSKYYNCGNCHSTSTFNK